jgi:4-amino-4-deoxy-L-arabinose transferase-like glycosyltransferase
MLSKMVIFFEPDFLIYLLYSSIIMMTLLISLYRKSGFLQYLLIIYFLICFSVISLNYLKPFLPQHGDSFRFYIPSGLKFANAWRKSILDSILAVRLKDFIEGNPAYVFSLGVVFFLSKNSLECARLLSSVFGLMLVYVLYQLIKDLFDEKTAKLTALLLACSPYFILLSCSILRDVHAVFFLVWFFRLWVRYEKVHTNKIRYLMLISLFCLGMLRPPVFLVIMSVILLYKTTFNIKKKSNVVVAILKVGLILGCLTYSVNYFYNSQTFQEYRLLRGMEYVQFDNMMKRNEGSSDCDSGYVGELHYSSYSEAILYLPLLVIYFMCSPLPWMVKKSGQALAIIDSSVLWFLYIFFFLEVRFFWKKNKKWASIIFNYLLIGICSAALIQGNMGAAVRHRLLFTVLILPFAAHGLLKLVTKKSHAQYSAVWGRQVKGIRVS